ncbi:hypothetical protein ACF3M2_04360 [Tissierella carlieri]|uniref:hypothetical protein n=1 Tax=Tissierella carlieri TaxID=689904 RepID=UPI00386CC6B5
MEKVRHITNTIRYLTDDYLKTSNGQLNILGKLLKILIIIIAIKIVISLTNKLIDKALEK